MARAPRKHLSVVDEPADPYRGIDSRADEYSPTSFYVTAADAHGHDDNRRIRMNAQVTSEVSRLLAAGKFAGTPVDSLASFIRDAMYHRLKALIDLGVLDDPITIAVADDYRRLARADSLTRDMELKQQVIDGARSALAIAVDADDHDAAKNLLELYEPMTERLREPYASQLESVLKAARKRLG